MANKIVLISDDSDFFDYIKSKLELRKSDELFTFDFDAIPEKVHLLETSLLIVNSENSQEKTLDLLKIFNKTPVIVSSFNDDDTFRRKCYRNGAFDFITLLTPDADFRARMIPALNYSGILSKNIQYRDILVANKVLAENSDVFIDYESILDIELEKIKESSKKAVFLAISPNEKSKFKIKTTFMESILINNIRKNDILMNYAPNKYFLLMFDTDINQAQKAWSKILNQFSEKIYAGFVQVLNQKRQQIVNEALNKLHEAINLDKNIVSTKIVPVNSLSIVHGKDSAYSNFKLFKQEFGRKIEQVITPVFYQIQQKYSGKLIGVNIEQGTGEGYGSFYIKGKHFTSCFRVTSPGFSKINIDITYQKDSANIDAKRITLEPEELEQGLLEDLLEQFILEHKGSFENDT